MTDNLPAIATERTLAPIATTDTDSWVEVMRPVIALADRICDTEFVPRGLRGSAPATAAAMLYGREIGLPPMTALGSTHVIEGKPGISAEIMRALILAAGHEIQFGNCTSASATIRGRRRGQEEWTVVEWTIDMARQAGLLSKKNWQTYPGDQLVARASTTLARRLFPDVIHGFSSLEELVDLGDGEDPAGPPAMSTTRVGRTAKKAAAKKSTPPPLEERRERPDAAGPPLPGESGFDPSLDRGTASGPSTEDGPDAGAEKVTETTDTGPVTGDPAPEAEPPGDGEGEAPDPGGSEARGPRMSSRAQHRLIFPLLYEIGISEEERHQVVGRIIGRPIESFNELTHVNASAVIETLGRVKSRDELAALLNAQRDQEDQS